VSTTPGNLLEFVWSSWKCLCDMSMIDCIVREPGASRGNFLLKLWDLSSDVYYMLPNRKNMLALWQPASCKMTAIFKMATIFLVCFLKRG